MSDRQVSVSMESRRHALALLAGAGAVLAGCGPLRAAKALLPDDTGAASPGGDSDLKRYAERGYQAAESLPIEPLLDTLRHDGEEVAISLLVPRSGVPRPLVLYLPGLGESVESGENRRQAWARAGYAVVAAQTVGDAGLLSSSAARNGDFTQLARAAFGAPALGRRLGAADFVLRCIEKKANAGEGIYARIDSTCVAVCGFDLGAQTALALAGEQHPALDALPPANALRAVVALSPHVNIAQGAFAKRFGGITLPALTITGTEDRDPYGLVDSPSTRQAAHAFMPPGGKHLLVLEGGTHATIGGAIDPARAEGGPAESSGDGRRGGRRPGAAGQGSTGAATDDRGRRGATRRPGGQDNSPRQRVIVERVSLAFLDAYAKKDPVASEWLARDAARWIDAMGRFESK